MLAIEKPKRPKVIKYVWWDGFNKEEVEKVFPYVGFSKCTVHDEDPYEITFRTMNHTVCYIEGGVYVCCELGSRDIFALSKEDFEERYNLLEE